MTDTQGHVLNSVPELWAAVFLCVHSCTSSIVGDYQGWALAMIAWILIMALLNLSL